MAGGAAQVVDVDTGDSLLVLDDEQQTATRVIAWSPDGSKIAASFEEDHGLAVWDAVTGKRLRNYTGGGNRGLIGDVEWSPDGRLLAWITNDQLQIRDFSTDREIIPASLGQVMGGNTMAFSPSGREIALSNNNKELLISVYDIGNGKEVHALRGHSATVTGISWNCDGSRLASSSADGTVRVWDSKHGSELLQFTEYADIAYSVAWSPDGRAIATGGGHIDRTVRIYDADKAYALGDPKPVAERRR